jgi:hypothetical protein
VVAERSVWLAMTPVIPVSIKHTGRVEPLAVRGLVE